MGDKEVVLDLSKKPNRADGFNTSIYVKRNDVDFVLAVYQWAKKNDLNFSAIVVSALKSFFLEPGDLFLDFKEIFSELTKANLKNTTLIHRGRKVKLDDLLNEEFVVNDTINRL